MTLKPILATVTKPPLGTSMLYNSEDFQIRNDFDDYSEFDTVDEFRSYDDDSEE